MSQRRQSNTQQRIIKQAIQTIAAKFLLNLPAQQKSQKVRLAYHYQKAYYFYIDEVMKEIQPREDPKKVQLKWFFDKLNEVVSLYMRKVDSEEIIKIMSRHKPTCGAIILNQKQTKVLVIQSGGKYGFPKGGKNQNQTAQDCAAREVRQQVGLFIHKKINSNDKVQFLGRQDTTVTYFIVRKFDEHQQLKIDKNQIDHAFWMNVYDVSKCLSKFAQKSRQAWKNFQSKLHIQPKITMDEFLSVYRDKGHKSKDKNKEIKDINVNPLLNFSLDKEKLFAVFNTSY